MDGRALGFAILNALFFRLDPKQNRPGSSGFQAYFPPDLFPSWIVMLFREEEDLARERSGTAFLVDCFSA